MYWPPTTTVGDILGALTVDPHSAICLLAPAGAGIRGIQVHILRLRSWRSSTSPWCQSEVGDPVLVGGILTPNRRHRRSAAFTQIMPSLCTGEPGGPSACPNAQI